MREILSDFCHFEHMMTENQRVQGVVSGMLKALKVLVQVLESDMIEI